MFSTTVGMLIVEIAPEVIMRFYITISERRARRARARMLVVRSRLIFHVENAGNIAKNATQTALFVLSLCTTLDASN